MTDLNRTEQEAAEEAVVVAPASVEPVEPTSPEVRSKGKLAKSFDWLLDKLTDAGVPVLKYGGGAASFAAEMVGVAGWPVKLGLIGSAWGLDKIGSRHPNTRTGKLCKAFGSGVWKGGVFGLVSNLVVNTVLPKEIGVISGGRVLPTQALAEKIHALDIPKILSNIPGSLGGAKTFVEGQAKVVGDFAVAQKNVAIASPLGQQVAAEAGKIGQQAGAVVGQAAAEVAPTAQAFGQVSQMAGQEAVKVVQQAVSTPEAKLATGVGLTTGVGALLNKLGLFGGKPKQT